MLVQTFDIFNYISIYLPPISFICFDIAILVFGYRIRKKNGYKYGLLFMISAVFSLIPSILFLALNIPYLPLFLVSELNLYMYQISIILSFIDAFFSILSIISAIFLVLALYLVYHTHNTPRVEPTTN